MAWYNATGKENDKSLYENNRVIDRCIFCGNHSEIKTTMTIYFSEFETNTGPICKSTTAEKYHWNTIASVDKEWGMYTLSA